MNKLLLIACSAGKLDGTHRAIDLYRGVMFDVLRKWMPDDQQPDVFIVSAKHGLLHADTMTANYEQPMTGEREQLLIQKGPELALFGEKRYSEVFIAGGRAYRELGSAYVDTLRAAGIVAQDAPVRMTEGGIGTQRGQLGQYLRGLA
jgi:hypothetical protein